MSRTAARTTRCTPATRVGRMAKAEQFLAAADVVEALADEADDVGDAYVTLCIHAGIAAADVICCAVLGEHARGENHTAAVELLSRADADAAKRLRDLLAMKTRAGYSAVSIGASQTKRAGRAAVALVEAARRS